MRGCSVRVEFEGLEGHVGHADLRDESVCGGGMERGGGSCCSFDWETGSLGWGSVRLEKSDLCMLGEDMKEVRALWNVRGGNGLFSLRVDP